MPDIKSSLTIDQMHTASKEAIVADISSSMSRQELIVNIKI